MSTRAVPIHRQEFRRLARRGRFRPFRAAALLTAVAVIRLAQAMRPRWRLITGLAGFLTEVLGFNVLSGGARDLSSLLGMGLLLFAMMKDARSCSSRQAGIPQATRPPC
ncbi:MAG: hypothetical protein M3Z75_20890 [Actinomycetota bacterium]|nr:hypothetical protein [Actinomycetota bacterium]